MRLVADAAVCNYRSVGAKLNGRELVVAVADTGLNGKTSI